MNVYPIIAWAGTALLVAFSFLFAEAGSTYRWSFIFLTPLLWLVYGLRKRLALLPAHFGLFVLALGLHDLGTFGFYERVFFGLRFDSYVHFAFGLVAGLILYRAFRKRLRLSPLALWVATPIFILGLGAIHELIECLTTLLLGPERGMLKLRPGEPFDTQKDLFNNLLGALLATLYGSIRPMSFWYARRRRNLRSATTRRRSLPAEAVKLH
jgi:uncharacterized membrane protein YjdF